MAFLVGGANAVRYMNPGHLVLTRESHHVLVMVSLGWESCLHSSVIYKCTGGQTEMVCRQI